MSYTTLFLDLDNTLLDFSKAEYHAIKTVLKNYGLPDENKIVGSKFKADKMFPRNGWAQNYCLSDKKRWQMVKQ